MRVLFLFLFSCFSTVAYAENADLVAEIKDRSYFPSTAKIGTITQRHYKGVSYACVTVSAKTGYGKYKTSIKMASKENGLWNCHTSDSFDSMNACLGFTIDAYDEWKRLKAGMNKFDEEQKKE
ncbi:MAG: hypothetical protein ACOYL3_15905 [Desulfuromonadaceae bacterium]